MLYVQHVLQDPEKKTGALRPCTLECCQNGGNFAKIVGMGIGTMLYTVHINFMAISVEGHGDFCEEAPGQGLQTCLRGRAKVWGYHGCWAWATILFSFCAFCGFLFGAI